MGLLFSIGTNVKALLGIWVNYREVLILQG
jgi:hypothetical protein